MIFVTVGAQMSFERLVRAIDDWAAEPGLRQVFAQIGPTQAPPRHLEWKRFLSPPEFRSRVEEASVIIGHAGMGTILTALQFAKPVIVMPRRGDLHETRNDHQVATARRFSGRPGIHVALDEQELVDVLQHIDAMLAGPPISAFANSDLLEAVRGFVHEGTQPTRVVPATPVVVTRIVDPAEQPA